MATADFLLIAGSASAVLAREVARTLGMSLAPCTIERFPDGELSVELGESVRRREVVLIQSTSPPVNDSLMELVLLTDACRRAAAAHITAIVPYFGYARADRRKGHRAAVSARAAATILESAGVGHLVTVDVHTAQVEGFFSIPIDDVAALPVLANAPDIAGDADTVIVAPDLGAVSRARDWSRCLDRPMALCLKQRRSGTTVEFTGVVGDVRGMSCLIVDDMISTGGTVAGAAHALREAGARDVRAVVATHGVFAPGAVERLTAAGVPRIVVTDTVAAHGPPADGAPTAEIASVAALLATVIRRIESGASLRGVS